MSRPTEYSFDLWRVVGAGIGGDGQALLCPLGCEIDITDWDLPDRTISNLRVVSRRHFRKEHKN